MNPGTTRPRTRPAIVVGYKDRFGSAMELRIERAAGTSTAYVSRRHAVVNPTEFPSIPGQQPPPKTTNTEDLEDDLFELQHGQPVDPPAVPGKLHTDPMPNEIGEKPGDEQQDDTIIARCRVHASDVARL